MLLLCFIIYSLLQNHLHAVTPRKEKVRSSAPLDSSSLREAGEGGRVGVNGATFEGLLARLPIASWHDGQTTLSNS